MTGTATVAAGSSVELQSTGAYAFAAGQRYVVVKAGSVGTYNTSTLQLSILGSASTLTATTANNDLVVTVNSATVVTTTNTGTSAGVPTTTPTTTTSASSAAGTIPTAPNAQRALGGLLSYTGTSNAALLNLYDAGVALEAYNTQSQVNRAGQQLAPITQ